MSCQARDGGLTQLFQHGNQVCLPALTNMGQVRQCAKSDLLQCIQVSQPIPFVDPGVYAVLFDGPAGIHMLSPTSKGANTFADYATSIFVL